MYNVHIYVQRVSKSQIYFYTGYMTVSSWKMPCSFKKKGVSKKALYKRPGSAGNL